MAEPCKILVVDDEPLLKSLVNQKFRTQIMSKQLEFHFASNGLEALDILKGDKEIAIVITDIRMSKMDGLTLLHHLNQQTRLYKTIVISAFGDMQNVRRAMAEGASDFILKPFDIMDFEISLMNVIEQYRVSKRDTETKKLIDEFSEDMAVAKELKNAFRPKNPLKRVQITGDMLLKSDLRNDCFDYYPLSDNCVGIVLADLISKKIALTFNTCRLQMLARGAALSDQDPKKVHQFLMKQMQNENTGLFFGTLDDLGALKYSFSGDVVVYSLPFNGHMERISDKLESLSLKKNETLLITTNKLLKLQNKGTFFSENSIEESLKGLTNDNPLQRLKIAIEPFLEKSKGENTIPILLISVDG